MSEAKFKVGDSVIYDGDFFIVEKVHDNVYSVGYMYDIYAYDDQGESKFTKRSVPENELQLAYGNNNDNPMLEQAVTDAMEDTEKTIIDNVNHPSHYETGKYECIEVMEEVYGPEAVKDFCLCNAFKYLYRTNRKNGVEDLKKAQWYINRYLKLSGETQ